MKRLLLALIVVTSVSHAGDRPSNVAELFMSAENIAFVVSPDRIEACVLQMRKPWFSRDLAKRKYKEGRYEVVPPSAVALLSTTLTAEDSYGWDYAKACWPTWNVRVKFFRGESYVSADLCFGCDILMLTRDGVPLGGEDFDNISDELFAVVQPLFPGDPVIRETIEQRKVQMMHAEEEGKLADRTHDRIPEGVPRRP